MSLRISSHSNSHDYYKKVHSIYLAHYIIVFHITFALNHIGYYFVYLCFTCGVWSLHLILNVSCIFLTSPCASNKDISTPNHYELMHSNQWSTMTMSTCCLTNATTTTNCRHISPSRLHMPKSKLCRWIIVLLVASTKSSFNSFFIISNISK